MSRTPNQVLTRFNDDATWAFVRKEGSAASLAIYPREDGTFSIGRPSAPGEWRDVETGFANMQAAIDQAEWLVTPSQRQGS